MKILTIIISYNFGRWVQPCLDSLIQSKTPTDILVIDNASTDDCLEKIKIQYPSVRIIENKENTGFGQANNIGFQIAIKENYDFVLLLNQDAWIDNDLLKTLTDLSDEFNDFGILSCVHLTGNRETTDSGSPGLFTTKEDTKADLLETPFVNAAIWLIPVRILKKVGGFSPLFLHYGEDVDFVNRMHYHGYKIGYCPYICGCHDRAKRVTTTSMEQRATAVYSLTLLADVHFTPITAVFKSFKCLAHHLGKSLIKGDFRGVKYFSKISLRLFSNLPTIFKERKTARTNGIDFINFIKKAHDLIPF